MGDLIIFDFCETLIGYQTADRFINFALSEDDIKESPIWPKVSKGLGYRYISIFFNKFQPELNFGKRVKLLSLKGIKEKALKKAAKKYNNQLKKDIIQPVFTKMLDHIKKGDHVIVVSGGYDIYINYFADDYNINYVCATQIKFKNQVCTGLFKGNDCMYKQKVNAVNQYIKQKNIQYNKSIFYTDSISDIALMKWVDKGIVISKNKSQSWAKHYGFKEIIWKSY